MVKKSLVSTQSFFEYRMLRALLREKDFIFEGTDCLLCEVGDHHPRFLEGEVHRCPNFFKALIIVIISWRSSHFVAVN